MRATNRMCIERVGLHYVALLLDLRCKAAYEAALRAEEQRPRPWPILRQHPIRGPSSASPWWLHENAPLVLPQEVAFAEAEAANHSAAAAFD